jgi:hypothetical protein
MLMRDPDPDRDPWPGVSSPVWYAVLAVAVAAVAVALLMVFVPGSHCARHQERGLTDRLVTECAR